jgi:hypothetical protein
MKEWFGMTTFALGIHGWRNSDPGLMNERLEATSQSLHGFIGSMKHRSLR